MFSAFVRESGTPVFSKRMLTRTVETFPDQLWLLGLWDDRQMAGGGLQFLLGDTVSGIWGAALSEHFNRRPNHLMYWESVRYGCQNGFRWLDLGRSRIGSGQHKFKLQWGGSEIPVYQQFYLRKGTKRPLVADDVAEGKARTLVRLWSKLPLPVTQKVGPVVRRHLPFV
jgi:predicted N-acyltransferase